MSPTIVDEFLDDFASDAGLEPEEIVVETFDGDQNPIGALRHCLADDIAGIAIGAKLSIRAFQHAKAAPFGDCRSHCVLLRTCVKTGTGYPVH